MLPSASPSAIFVLPLTKISAQPYPPETIPVQTLYVINTLLVTDVGVIATDDPISTKVV